MTDATTAVMTIGEMNAMDGMIMDDVATFGAKRLTSATFLMTAFRKA